MSASSLSVSSPATATVLEGIIPPALFLLVPLFTLALVLLALSHRPQQQETTSNERSRPQARVAYAFIAVLAVFSTLAGALPLSHGGSPQAEAVVQALLSSFLAIPALHLGSSSHYSPSSSSSRALLGLLHSGILVITLSGAALFALILPFLHSSPTTPQYLPPTLFLFYSLLAFPRISWSLYRFLHPATTTRASHIRRPITIHISTQRTSVPLSLSSSVASFSVAQELAKPNSSVIEERDSRIELAITLPKRNDSRRSRLNEEDERDEEEKSHPQDQKHKHDRSLSSTSSTSTITAVDHATRATSNFPLISLTTPPRAAYTSAYIPSFEPIGTLSTHPPIEEHLYRFPDQSNPEQSAFSTEDNEVEGINSKSLRTQLIHNRSRSLLVFLSAAQLTLIVGYSCTVSAIVSSDSKKTVLPLRIVQAACTVLAVTGTMSAYLLHAYNTHLSPSRSRGSRRNRISLIDSEQPQPQPRTFLSSPFSSSSSATAVSPSTQQLHYQGIQMIEDDSSNARPALIQLEPLPPPRTRRKRVDATLGSALDRNHSSYPRSASGSSNSYEEQISIHQGAVDRAYGRRHYSGDVSYTYPYTHSRTSSGQYREPIVLSYEPPKVRTPEDASLLEMTEPEGRGLEMDLDFGGGEEQHSEYMDEDLELDLAVEMQKALTISRSSSRATSRSAWSNRRGHTRAASHRRRTSASTHAAAARRMSASFQVTTATSKAMRNSTMVIDLPRANYNGANATRKKSKAKEDDPATYIRKRGSLPATPQTKKLFGWEFGWEQLPLASRSKSTTRGRESEYERDHATFGSVDVATENSFMEMMKADGVAGQPTRARKLKKRSKSALRRADAESTMASQSVAYPLPTRPHLPEPAVESPPSSASYNTFGVRRHRSRSPSRPETPESKKSHGSHGSKSSFGSGEGMPPNIRMQGHDQSHRPVLNLKRSFKMGVGRTLGPSLTLASVDNGDDTQKRRDKGIDRDEDFRHGLVNEEESDDVDSEIQSIAAAKVVSATIARASPAATIVTAPVPASMVTPPPSTPSGWRYPVSPMGGNIKYPALISTPRPFLPAIVTAGATPTDPNGRIPFPKSAPPTMKSSSMPRTPSSMKAPHTSGSTWRPHPFADPVESQQTTRRTSVPASYANDSSTDDDMVSLEREMEEIRGLRSGGQNKMDSPTTQFKELAALMSIPMPTAPTLPSPVPSPRKLKEGIFTGQKQSSMSNSPTTKSDWVPISTPSAAGAASNSSQEDYPYRFPMFFPGSNSNSPPRVQQTPTNARGPGSGLRLSAKTMETVRSAFAGVSARMSMRTSMHSTAAGSTKGGGNFGETIVEDRYGDFMDLCDPFASPPMPASTIPIAPVVKKKSSKHSSVTRDVGEGSWVDSSIIEEIEELGTKKMSAWGKLPVPVRSYSPNLGASSKRHSGNGRVAVVRAVGKPSRRHKKDKRSRKSTLPGASTKPQTLAEDSDFGLEEALLSQRLLSRLDAHGWEGRV